MSLQAVGFAEKFAKPTAFFSFFGGFQVQSADYFFLFATYQTGQFLPDENAEHS